MKRLDWSLQHIVKPVDANPLWDPDDEKVLDEDEDCRVFEDKKNEFQVHCDEKYFIESHNGQRIRLYPTTLPDGRIKHILPSSIRMPSKRHRAKVMTFCAVGRPFWDVHGELVFDGKVMIEHCVEEHIISQGKRKGQIDLTNVSVGGKASRKYLKMTFEAIVRTMEHARHGIIWLQWDNAPGHKAASTRRYAKYLETMYKKKGWDIRVVLQPPRSPDQNVNDLLIFKIMSRITSKQKISGRVELRDAINDAWEEMDPQTISRGWVNLFSVMYQIVACLGGNEFKAGHFGIRKAWNQASEEPVTSYCPAVAVFVDEEKVAKGEAMLKDYKENPDKYIEVEEEEEEDDETPEGAGVNDMVEVFEDDDSIDDAEEEEEEEEEELPKNKKRKRKRKNDKKKNSPPSKKQKKTKTKTNRRNNRNNKKGSSSSSSSSSSSVPSKTALWDDDSSDGDNEFEEERVDDEYHFMNSDDFKFELASMVGAPSGRKLVHKSRNELHEIFIRCMHEDSSSEESSEKESSEEESSEEESEEESEEIKALKKKLLKLLKVAKKKKKKKTSKTATKKKPITKKQKKPITQKQKKSTKKKSNQSSKSTAKKSTAKKSTVKKSTVKTSRPQRSRHKQQDVSDEGKQESSNTTSKKRRRTETTSTKPTKKATKKQSKKQSKKKPSQKKPSKKQLSKKKLPKKKFPNIPTYKSDSSESESEDEDDDEDPSLTRPPAPSTDPSRGMMLYWFNKPSFPGNYFVVCKMKDAKLRRAYGESYNIVAD